MNKGTESEASLLSKAFTLQVEEGAGYLRIYVSRAPIPRTIRWSVVMVVAGLIIAADLTFSFLAVAAFLGVVALDELKELVIERSGQTLRIRRSPFGGTREFQNVRGLRVRRLLFLLEIVTDAGVDYIKIPGFMLPDLGLLGKVVETWQVEEGTDSEVPTQ